MFHKMCRISGPAEELFDSQVGVEGIIRDKQAIPSFVVK
jgi:hypothetical protein